MNINILQRNPSMIIALIVVSLATISLYVTKLLRDEWGFKGIALDDNGGMERLVTWRVASDKVSAAALALKVGNDVALKINTYPEMTGKE
jgi:beta-glucosidase-like glycosyl hydrolase